MPRTQACRDWEFLRCSPGSRPHREIMLICHEIIFAAGHVAVNSHMPNSRGLSMHIDRPARLHVNALTVLSTVACLAGTRSEFCISKRSKGRTTWQSRRPDPLCLTSCICICIDIYVHVYISIYPIIHLPIYLSMCFSIHMFTYLYLCLPLPSHHAQAEAEKRAAEEARPCPQSGLVTAQGTRRLLET